MPETKPYVLLFSDESFSLIGPFADGSAAASAGERWQAEHDDNPCWQVVELTAEQVSSPLPVAAPAAA